MTEKSIRLIFFSKRTCTYAMNVLMGALESSPFLPYLDIFFLNKEKSLIESIQSGLRNNQKIVVGWSFFSPDFIELSLILQKIKSEINNPSVIHILGGVHATAEPKQSLRVGFDLVALGEGENIILEFISNLIEEKDYFKTKGLAYIKNGKFISNGYGALIDLNDYPPFAIKYRRLNPIEITRGCIYACRFCQTPFMFKAKFRHRSIRMIKYYVQIMMNIGITDIRFITPTSLSYGSTDESVNLMKLEELLSSIREIIGKKGRIFFGTFPSEVRPEHITPESLQILKKYVDNNNLIIGGQSGSEKILNSSKRGHNVESILRAVRYVKEFGFQANVDFIFGLPGETQNEIQESLKFADILVSLGARIHGHTFIPLPGTPYKNSPPGTIHPPTLKELHRLESKGGLYGQWKKQLNIAENLSNWDS